MQLVRNKVALVQGYWQTAFSTATVNPKSAEFDHVAKDYIRLLDKATAITGETSEYFAEYKSRYLARILPPTFSGEVLDFGCGVGLLSGFLKKYLPAAHINGFDVSRESISHVSATLAGRGVFTSERSELAENYDLIVVANVMHHITPAERAQTVADLETRLAPHGKLVVFEHNPANPLTRWVVDRCAFDKDVVLLPASETGGYFAAANLRLIRRDYIVFMPRVLSWLRRLEPWLRWLPLGAQYVFVGERAADIAKR